MRPEIAKLLHDARSACAAVEAFTHGKDYTAYAADVLLRSAVERQFEIVGEALGRAVRRDPALETAIPEIHRIVGLRNRLIHGYDSVDDQLVWDLVQTKLPALARVLDVVLQTG
ncbi:MAG TPA: DUF86 domain-containing protein [Bryobacteraceae bacterium]|nr:DUF86 domain-containing protein [Bryobacteraceae bacterium]